MNGNTAVEIGLSGPCLTPPFGFVCTRGFGHGGPCAAFEIYDLTLAQQFDALKNTLIATNREYSKVIGQVLQHSETCKEQPFPHGEDLAVARGAEVRDLRTEIERLEAALHEVPYLRREICELRISLRWILRQARETSAAANHRIIHMQVLNKAREVVDESDEDRIARYMELEAMEEADDE